ncbi:unnamed protein product [Meloidogyne enterolobii]|uniref:Uncharacterized protein n=1 Tax=Meloidogyne enterolobii TaxID=390850 RepID=A0ACB1ASP4_MELEN
MCLRLNFVYFSIADYYNSFLRKHEDNQMYFLLELGGKSLGEYYRQKVSERHGRNARVERQFLKNILKGAAQALLQFHQRE